jgi:hypothetical protein
LKKLTTVTKKSRRPHSRAELEKKVVAHAMRHIAFLIQTDDANEFRSVLRPAPIQVFEKL